ncbi:uncharacterized protein DUF2156 [Prosthecobacter fusiformis]|uniref:Uncharacterized protein DUF2156 n=1 Tax=Prosthecobacter fusiformis TaxID=48464 RepID=A0A4R7RM38_9BACT|nr:DUF2156 domain-containing protein [Prosthecobacter fusiformis]TDU64652.1 uncharacterized protein DUF2156 [Prosthecobacter fusiformis]
MPSILGKEAKSIDPVAKWNLLSPSLKRYGAGSLSYATLQQGMEYFIHELGYIAFITATHPVFARKPKRIILTDPVCDPSDLSALITAFLQEYPAAVFGVVSEHCAGILRQIGFKVNCVGYEPELAVQTYNTQGNWKELDMIKRARNEAKREGLTIREVDIATVPIDQLHALSSKWLQGKKVNDREIWIYARRPVYQHEPDVRKFVAFDKAGTAVGYVFYDPMYRDGKVYGYSANIVRCDEAKYGRLATTVHMVAMETFKTEGIEVLNLLLCPFTNLDKGIYADDLMTKWFFQISQRFGGEIYNFKGLAFHKSKYRGYEKPVYYASNSALPSNDVYLAFLTADIAKSYFATMKLLGIGVIKELYKRKPKPAKAAVPTAQS